jgi:hypothetical protein
VEFDPIHQTHLVVGTTTHLPGLSVASATLDLQGRLMGDPVDLTGPDEPMNAWPRLAYSPDLAQGSVRAGAMVTWAARGQVYARAVLSDGSLSAGGVIGSWAGRPDSLAFAYSKTERRFFDVWDSHGRLIGLDAQLVGAVVNFDQPSFTNAGFAAVWNPLSNEFAVLYSRWHPERGANSFLLGDWSLDLVRIALDGTVLTRTQVAFLQGLPQKFLIAVNSHTGEYTVLWGIFGAEISPSGRVISRGSPTPTPTPTPTPGGCTTPDPFVALGGGTCVNGGWFPPGMGAPAPPSTPPSTPAPGGCLTPDPFVALGGGRCINGGWYPPGMGSSATPK